MLAQRATPGGVGELSQNEIAQVAGVAQSYVNKVLSDPELITGDKLCGPCARSGDRATRVYQLIHPVRPARAKRGYIL